MKLSKLIDHFSQPRYKLGAIKTHQDREWTVGKFGGIEYYTEIRYSIKVYLLNGTHIDPLRYWEIFYNERGRVTGLYYENKHLKITRRVRGPLGIIPKYY
jgi:hypothetical protein